MRNEIRGNFLAQGWPGFGIYWRIYLSASARPEGVTDGGSGRWAHLPLWHHDKPQAPGGGLRKRLP